MTPRALLVRSIVRWLFLTLIVVALGLTLGWMVNLTDHPPVDYRIQLPTLPIGDMP